MVLILIIILTLIMGNVINTIIEPERYKQIAFFVLLKMKENKEIIGLNFVNNEEFNEENLNNLLSSINYNIIKLECSAINMPMSSIVCCKDKHPICNFYYRQDELLKHKYMIDAQIAHEITHIFRYLLAKKYNLRESTPPSKHSLCNMKYRYVEKLNIKEESKLCYLPSRKNECFDAGYLIEHAIANGIVVQLYGQISEQNANCWKNCNDAHEYYFLIHRIQERAYVDNAEFNKQDFDVMYGWHINNINNILWEEIQNTEKITIWFRGKKIARGNRDLSCLNYIM